MANYGPPGGPYPGPPREPVSDPDRQAIDEYGQPVDPWGDHDQLGGHSQLGDQSQLGGQADYPPARYRGLGDAPAAHPGSSAPFPAPPAGWAPAGPDPVWSPPVADQPWPANPDPAPRGGGARVFFGILATLALLVVGGAALGFYLFDQDRSTPTAGPTGGTPVRSGSPTSPAPAAPAPAQSTDARFAKVGQCVVNQGTEADPQLSLVECAPHTYEVLARYNGSTTGDADAQAKCAKVEEYTNYFFFNSELDELDYVLCLGKR